MSNPVKHLLRRGAFGALGLLGPLDHDDRKREIPRGIDLCIRPRTSTVLRHDAVDPVTLHKRAIRVPVKGSAIHDHLGVGQGQRTCWRIDKTEQIAVLRVRRERGQMHAPDGQHHDAPRSCQRLNRACDIGYQGPVVTRLRPPSRAGEGHQRHPGLRAGRHSVPAHLHGKGMGGVDHMRDPFGPQISAKTGWSAKPADAHGKRLAPGAFDPSGKRKEAGNPRLSHQTRQGRCLGCATKYQELGRHV